MVMTRSLADVEGYLFKVATPVFAGTDEAVRYSWGASYGEWLYAKTTEEMIDLAAAWANECHDLDLKRRAA